MGTYSEVLKRLNLAQRQAVEQIDGPLLVIAGPGTGKTQLLSARVAHILEATDTLPQNILCLTFTESGAANMRERLSSFIGRAAYDIQISTYHAFGGELIRRFPEYFSQTRLEQPVDELGKRQIVERIVEAMSYTNPLKSAQYHLHDLLATISEVKRGLLDEAALRAIAAENLAFISTASDHASRIFTSLAKMPSKLDKAAPYFEQLLSALRPLAPEAPAHDRFGSLAAAAIYDLEQAIAAATDSASTKPLTAWKNTWLEKDTAGAFIFAGELQNKRIEALADVMRQYQAALTERGLYDFDDMILRSIQALSDHPDLRFTLQERYLYVLLDEFQDTNAAQLQLIRLITDSPVHEGRPNVMAVGDDDQAIYAFQGAEYSNMLDFFQMYRDVQIVHLTENYRSHPDILHVAHQVAGQIDARLTAHFSGMSKILTAARRDLPPQAVIGRREFLSDVSQYDWIARQIQSLIEQGTKPADIAVLAPRHKQLEPLVPFLNDLGIPVRYEKRENILEAPVVHQLLTMSKLILALGIGNASLASSLWPEVLSYEFWQLPTSAIWRMSWKVAADKSLSWSEALLADPTFRIPALLVLRLAHQAHSETLEVMLDRLIGNEYVQTGEQDLPKISSPLRDYYLSEDMKTREPELFYQTFSHLTTLRQKLSDHAAVRERVLTLADLLDFVHAYEAAEERMLNTSPYNQHAEAVQLMTVFKAKGLEFEHVFLPSCQDEVWGESSRASSNRLTLPPNLAAIRPAGTTEDERLRIFFVAITRAKRGLHLTSFLQTYSGKATKRLKYLDEQEQPNGSFASMVLPAARQTVQRTDHEAPAITTLELNWRTRHLSGVNSTRLHDLLQERLAAYRLSPTHLTSFTDMVHGGPEAFFFDHILRFPHAPTADIYFGISIHETLQWLQEQLTAKAALPSPASAVSYFTSRLQAKKLAAAETAQLTERGRHALTHYLAQRAHIFRPGDRAEHNFASENVLIGDVRMSGAIDRMEIDQASKTIVVVDYKTGKSFDRWTADPKLHKFMRQLYCYKLLIEHSNTFQGYHVGKARVEFVEPDSQGRIHTLELNFNESELQTTMSLLDAVWHHVHTLDFPDITGYDKTLTGTKQFEHDLIQNTAG